MKNFETHHVTIDLNEIDQQSTLQSTGCKNTLKSCEDPSKNTWEKKRGLGSSESIPNAYLENQTNTQILGKSNIMHSPITTLGKISKMIDRTPSHPKLTPKKAIKQSPMSHSKVIRPVGANYKDGSPMKEFIHNTLRDEYVIKNHNSVRQELENQDAEF